MKLFIIRMQMIRSNQLYIDKTVKLFIIIMQKRVYLDHIVVFD